MKNSLELNNKINLNLSKIAKRAVAMCAIVATLFVLCGCKEPEKDTEIVFTTEFADDEVFRIDDASCYVPEVNIYMRTSQDQYESVFGPEILDKIIEGTTLQNQLKDTILARLAQIKVMNLLARENGIDLTDEEKEMAKAASRDYVLRLSDEERDALKANQDIVCTMYEEYALANKVYSEITKDVNPEISDDEARTISVKHILIKTYYLDENGQKVEFTDSQKRDAKRRISDIKSQLKKGANFDDMVEKYNEDDESTYSFGKGSMPQPFEDAAFALDTDGVSDIVETEYGYHIIKCLSTFDRTSTDENKKKIVEMRKNEVFSQVYDEYIKTLYSNINQKMWDSLDFKADENITTTNFFDVYREVFEENNQ